MLTLLIYINCIKMNWKKQQTMMSATLKTKSRIFKSIDICLSIIYTDDILTCKKSSKLVLENKKYN